MTARSHSRARVHVKAREAAHAVIVERAAPELPLDTSETALNLVLAGKADPTILDDRERRQLDRELLRRERYDLEDHQPLTRESIIMRITNPFQRSASTPAYGIPPAGRFNRATQAARPGREDPTVAALAEAAASIRAAKPATAPRPAGLDPRPPAPEPDGPTREEAAEQAAILASIEKKLNPTPDSGPTLTPAETHYFRRAGWTKKEK